MNKKRFMGAYTALVTPFKDGALDEESFRAHIEWQIAQGIHGLVPCGTTGESATLTHAEHERVIKICVEQVKGRVPVIAGAGSNNTAEAIRLTAFAKSVGVDGVLHIMPYYNKPTQEGLYEHFKAIMTEVSVPTLLYNVPGRTACNILPETVGKLAHEFEDICGIKEATADLTQISRVIEECPDNFALFSGDDFTVLPILAVGGCGVISVTSNVAPQMMSALCNAFQAGDLVMAKRLHYAIAPLNRAMFMETNPIPVKTAMNLLGFCTAEFRLPLVNMSYEKTQALGEILKQCALMQ